MANAARGGRPRARGASGAASPIATAAILVAIGSLLALRTLDVSGGSPLLNLVHGPQTAPTFATLGAKKLAELVLFAAFVDLAIVIGLGRGALVAALTLAAQPIASADSGALFPLAGGAAMVLGGRCVAARVAPAVADLVGGGFAFLGAILVSPWLLGLLGLIWLPREGARPRGRVTQLGALVLPFAVAVVAALTLGGPLVPDDPLGRAHSLGAMLVLSVPTTSLAIVALALVLAALAAAPFVLGSVSSLLAAAIFFGVDLGAPFVAAILFAFAVAAGVDRVSAERPWATNLAAVTVFFFALAPTPEPLLLLLHSRREQGVSSDHHPGAPS